MHTDSSASRTCRDSRSASLNTATVAMRSSRQARMTRSAISPRLAIRTLRNTEPLFAADPVGLGRLVADLAQSDRGIGGRLDRLPGPVGGGGDALELEREFVRVVAVPERLLLG